MKTIMTLSVALVLSVAAPQLTGCVGNRYKESTGEVIDDSGITHRVKASLGRDTMYKYPDVKVATFKGTVQLSGFVNDRAQKSRATELAKDVEGVKEVVNNITIKD